MAKPAVEEVGKAAGAAGAANGLAQQYGRHGGHHLHECGGRRDRDCMQRARYFAYGDIENFPTYAPLLKSVRIVGEAQRMGAAAAMACRALVRVVGMGRLIKWEPRMWSNRPNGWCGSR